MAQQTYLDYSNIIANTATSEQTHTSTSIPAYITTPQNPRTDSAALNTEMDDTYQQSVASRNPSSFNETSSTAALHPAYRSTDDDRGRNARLTPNTSSGSSKSRSTSRAWDSHRASSADVGTKKVETEARHKGIKEKLFSHKLTPDFLK